MLQGVPFSLPGALLLPAASILAFSYLFRHIRNVAITRSVRFTPAVMLLRACLAAAIILAITAAARVVGPAWAGVFSAFPTALFPLMLIVHLTYDKAHVHTIIKNFPLGLGSLDRLRLRRGARLSAPGGGMGDRGRLCGGDGLPGHLRGDGRPAATLRG